MNMESDFGIIFINLFGDPDTGMIIYTDLFL